AFLNRTILIVDAPDAGVGCRALDLAIEQVVVLHVALRDERAGDQLGRKRATRAAHRKVLVNQRPIRVIGYIEGRGAMVVDRNPGSSAGREADERNEAIGRQQSLGHSPVVGSLADRTTGAVAEAVVGVVHDDLGRPVQSFHSWIYGPPIVTRRSRRV